MVHAGWTLVVELFLIGTVASVVGTLVGLGGGFVVVPVLRLFYGIAPATTAGVSLFMVLANAVSGSIAYSRQRRADVRAALLVAATGIPFSILGAFLVQRAPPTGFDLPYAALIVYVALNILRRRNRRVDAAAPQPAYLHERILIDRYGEEFIYYESVPLTLLCGAFLGFAASYFGVGGGIVFIPFFIVLFRMPPHVVTATSTLAILLTSPVGVAIHALHADIDWTLALPLAAGGLVGGQLGPPLARRLSSPRLVTVLAFVLLAAAAALIAKHVRF